MLPLPWWKQSSVVNLPPSRWLSTPENGSISRAQCSLCFWQTGQLLAIARSLSVNASPYFQARAWASIPTTLATLIMSLWVMTRVAGERDGLVSAEKVNPFTWLLKFLLAEFILWWEFMWDTNIFTLFAHSERPIYIPLSPNFFVPFSNHVPSRSLTIQPNHWLSPWIGIELQYGHLSFQAQCPTRYTAGSSDHWEDSPSPSSFRDVPQRGYSVATVHL